MAKTQSKIITETVKPLYAVAGVTEVAYEFARGYALEAQTRVSEFEREPKALQNQAVSIVNARFDELSKDAKEAQNKFEARVAELQKEARALPKKVQDEIDETVTELARTYADLVDRGEKIVTAIRKDGVKAVSAVRKAPSKSSVVRREKAKVAADKPKNSSRPVKKSATEARREEDPGQDHRQEGDGRQDGRHRRRQVDRQVRSDDRHEGRQHGLRHGRRGHCLTQPLASEW